MLIFVQTNDETRVEENICRKINKKKTCFVSFFLDKFASGLHLSNISTLKNGAVDLVNHKISSKEVVVVASDSHKRMKMNCLSNVPARLVLYFLSWSGFLVSFMMRNDINFALVVMVKTNNVTDATLSTNVTESATYVSSF